MPKIFNKDNLDYKLSKASITEFSWYRSEMLSSVVNSDDYIFDIKKLGADKYSYPYHYHINAEEIFIILDGHATLRTPKGFFNITKGDIVFFEKGPEGAHQLYNHSKDQCIYLDIRSKKDLDICEYPDTEKINILQTGEMYFKDRKAGYFEGEEHVKDKWFNYKLKDISEM